MSGGSIVCYGWAIRFFNLCSMKSLFLALSVVSLLALVGCTGQSADVADMPQFETIDEYMELVLNDAEDTYVVEKPEGYGPVLFGDKPTIVRPDGAQVDFILLVEDTSTGLHDDHQFYLEGTLFDDDCHGDVLQGVIEPSECPDLVKWYGPFYGKALDFIQ